MSSRPKVFVSRVIPDAGLKLIREQCDAEVWPDQLPPPYEMLLRKVADCDGLVSMLSDRIDAALINAAPRLRIISNFAVGFNNIDVAAATARGIAVGNTPGILTDATADTAFALLIGAARRIVETQRYVLDGKWKTWEPVGHLGQDLAGRTVGVVGMGRIGYAFAKRCRFGWDMQVLYSDVNRNVQADSELGAKHVDFETLLRQSDFVSLHANLTDATRNLIGAAQLRMMKPTAVLINTARGPMIDQKALYEALKAGTIFAAGLDVTEPEPPDPNDPLLRLPNIIVLPHIASATIGTRNAMAEICAANLLAGLKGEKLQAWVNPEVAANRR